MTCVGCGIRHDSFDMKETHEKVCKPARKIKINRRMKRDDFQAQYEFFEDSDIENENFDGNDFSDPESDINNVEMTLEGKSIKLPGKYNENGT